MPVTASRQYFYFGKPVDLSPDLVNDLEKSRKIYNEVSGLMRCVIVHLGAVQAGVGEQH